MSKKKLKKMLRRALKNGYDARPQNDDFAINGDGYGFGGAPRLDGGWLSRLGLPKGFAAGQTEQFIIGALLGAGAAYVLADEELRNKIMKSLMKLYAGLTGGLEEFKEQMADLKAEVAAEHGSQA
jgi:hypothetical protein